MCERARLSHNPIADHPKYRETVIKTLPHLVKLDDKEVTVEEVERAKREGLEIQPRGATATADDDGEEGEQEELTASIDDSLLQVDEVSGRARCNERNPVDVGCIACTRCGKVRTSW
jgi:hypothetical protein